VLGTRFRIGAAGAAAIGAAGLAAAELWARRAGRARQPVGVDLRRVTAALASSRYLRIDGAPPRNPFDPVSGFFAAGNGRSVMLHCNFPNHRAAALHVLGLADDATREGVAAAVRAAADGLTLETAIHHGGGCAALVRSAEEWRSEAPAAAVATLPLIEIERIGEARRRCRRRASGRSRACACST
jgi:hypothetical protein